MGWLYMQSLGGFKSPKQYLDNQFTFNGNKVLKSALCGMRTYYAAVQHSEGEVFAVVCLVRYNPRDKEGYIFGYKDMDETMGPCESACPQDILDLLTPTEAPYANAWRARCRERLTKPKAKIGDTIEFEQPIRFTDGSTHSAFTLVKPQWKTNLLRFQAVNGGGVYRISRWKERNFNIVGAK